MRFPTLAHNCSAFKVTPSLLSKLDGMADIAIDGKAPFWFGHSYLSTQVFVLPTNTISAGQLRARDKSRTGVLIVP